MRPGEIDPQRRVTRSGYDADDNLTSDGTNTYNWDARGHLSAIGGGSAASFSYDALGRRTSATINGATTSYWVRRSPWPTPPAR